jgi:dethiobiotin synthetase
LNRFIRSWLFPNELIYFLARFVVRIRNPFIIGITGSVGKTTTTEMIAAVLTHPGAEQIVGKVAVTNTLEDMNNDLALLLPYCYIKITWSKAGPFLFGSCGSLPFPVTQT